MPVPSWFIDISDPSASALMASANGQQSQGSLTFFHNDILGKNIALLTKPVNPGEPLQFVDIDGGDLQVTIGIPDDVIYFESGSLVPSTPPAGAATLITTGSATQNAVFDVALGADSIGGSFQLTFGRPHSWKVSIPANTAIKANGVITCVDGAALADTFFDLPGASSAIVRFWYDQGAGTAPATPTGGSVSAITGTTAGDTNITIASITSAALEAHADFTSSVITGAMIRWIAAAVGTKTTIADDGTSGHGVTTTSQGNSGALDQKTFQIADEDGTVAIWFDAVSAGTDGYPDLAATAARQIRVAVTPDTSGATVATAMASAIDADSKYTATAAGGTVTVVMVASGDMGFATAAGMSGVAGFNITNNNVGSQTTYLLPWGASAAFLNNAFDGAFTAEDSSLNQWRITAAVKGAYAAPTLVESGLTNYQYFPMSLTVDSVALTAAFTAAPDDLSISAYCEVQYADTDGNISTVLQIPCDIKRDLIT